MTAQTTDGRERRIANDTQLVFMGRTIERLYGADALDALVAYNRNKAREAWHARAPEAEQTGPGAFKSLFSPDAHDYEIVHDSPDCLEVVVKHCVHADVFRSYNAADLGEKLICNGDFAAVDGFSPDLELIRKTTCMTGQCCRFVFRRKQKS